MSKVPEKIYTRVNIGLRELIIARQRPSDTHVCEYVRGDIHDRLKMLYDSSLRQLDDLEARVNALEKGGK